MTALEHNKFVGWAHFGYGVLHLLMLIFTFGFMGVMIAKIFGEAERMGGEPPPAFFAAIMIIAGGINVVLTIPSFVAAYALLKRRSWAKIAGIVAGVLACLSFPLGTLVGVYTFWFLFSEAGRSVYDVQPQMPPPPPGDWARPNQSTF